MGKKDKKDKKKDKGSSKSSSKALTKTFKGLGKLIYTLVVLGLIGGVILYAYNAGWFDKAREAAEQLIEKATHRPDDALKAIVKEAIPLAEASYTAAEQPKTMKLPLVAIEPKGTFVIGGFHFADNSFQTITLPVKGQPAPLSLSTNDKASGLAFLKLDTYDGPSFPKATTAPKAKDPVFLITFSDSGEQNIVVAHVKETNVKEENRTLLTVTVDPGSFSKIPVAVVNKNRELIGVIAAPGELKGDEAIFKAIPADAVKAP